MRWHPLRRVRLSDNEWIQLQKSMVPVAANVDTNADNRFLLEEVR